MWDRNYSLKVQPTLYTWLIAPYSAVLIGIVLLGINMHPIPVFNSQDLIAFAPQPQCTSSTFIDTVFLVAQWRNPHAVPLPCTFLPLFLIFNIAILLLLFIGGWKHKKLAIGAMLCIMLADIPLITAMRDSAKYIADLAIIEIILLGYAVAYIYNKTKNATLPWVVLVLVIVNGFPMYWGLSHTSTPASYPSSWYEWNKQLATLHEKPQVLFLPWHLYMPFDFTNQETIANPANIFFTNATIIRGDNLEMRQGTVSIYSESTSNLSREVEDALSGIHDLDFADRLSLLLTKENIKYVALASGSPEEAMYRETFNKIPSLSISYTAAGLTVWKFGE
ncbi:MAG TPA: hypothetical protein VLG69_03330 [Candidatus Andersenbacteria bacterium]|nr:hypothetical protein [Candidatus Andersenbacteria bacterium]